MFGIISLHTRSWFSTKYRSKWTKGGSSSRVKQNPQITRKTYRIKWEMYCSLYKNKSKIWNKINFSIKKVFSQFVKRSSSPTKFKKIQSSLTIIIAAQFQPISFTSNFHKIIFSPFSVAKVVSLLTVKLQCFFFFSDE